MSYSSRPPKSSYRGPRGPVFPPELLAEIVGHVAHMPTLRSCAATCMAMQWTAQKKLFEDISIHLNSFYMKWEASPKQCLPPPRNTISKLHETISGSRSPIHSFIKTLRIYVGTAIPDHKSESRQAFSMLFRSLPKLKTLMFPSCHDGYKLECIYAYFPITYFDLIAFKLGNVRKLDVSAFAGPNFLPTTDFYENFPRLEDLEVDVCDPQRLLRFSRVPLAIDNSNIPLDPLAIVQRPRRLRSFTITTEYMPFAINTLTNRHCIFDLSYLRNLELKDVFMPIYKDQLTEFLKLSRGNLRTFSCQVNKLRARSLCNAITGETEPYHHALFSPPDIPTLCPNLREIVLGGEVELAAGRNMANLHYVHQSQAEQPGDRFWNPVDWMCDLLSAYWNRRPANLQFTNQLEKITLRLSITGCPSVDVLPKLGWERLGSILSSTRFPALRTLRIEVEVTGSTEVYPGAHEVKLLLRAIRNIVATHLPRLSAQRMLERKVVVRKARL